MSRKGIEVEIRRPCGIGGAVVGYEIVHGASGVITQSVEFAEPIKNMVVDSGLEILVGGQPSALAGEWLRGGRNTNSTSSIQSGGALRQCGLGEIGTPTTADMTNLLDPAAEWTDTVAPANSSLASHARHGTWYDVDITGATPTRIKCRITHQFTVEQSQGKTVREFGWRRWIGDDATAVLFSRVALPSGSEITIPTEHYLMVTYEVAVELPYIVPTIFDDINIANMPAVRGEQRLDIRLPAQSTSWGNNGNQFMPVIDTGGNHVAGQNPRNVGASHGVVGVSLNPPANNTVHQGAMVIHRTLNTPWESLDVVSNINTSFWRQQLQLVGQPYVADSRQARGVVTVPINWDTGDITFDRININGMGYRFGYYDADDEWVSTPITKSAEQQLVLDYSITWARLA